jgi:hypothetical protein
LIPKLATAKEWITGLESEIKAIIDGHVSDWKLPSDENIVIANGRVIDSYGGDETGMEAV